MGLEILDVALGLILVYLVLSLVCSAAVEAIGQRSWIRARARTLNQGLERLLGRHSQTLLRHAQIQSLSDGKKAAGNARARWRGVPSYIPTEAFATACLEFVEGYQPKASADREIQRTTLESIRLIERDALASDPDEETPSRELSFARSMRSFWERADGDREAMLGFIGEWFDSAMERVMGNYRRWAQKVSFLVALLIVPMVNADTVRITTILYRNPEVRAQVAAQVEAMAGASDAAGQPPAADGELKVAVDKLRKLDPLLGWAGVEVPWYHWVPGRFIGWLITILAASMGSPFWFKLLGDLLRARTKITSAEDPENAKDANSKPSTPTKKPSADKREAAETPAPRKRLDFTATFEPGTIAHSHGNGYWLGKMAEVAYQDKQGFASAMAICKPEKLDFVSKKGTQVQVAVWSNYAVVAFRGTETNVADIATDAKFSLSAWDGAGQVHSGFLEALEDIWTPLCKLLTQRGVGPEKGLWFTGHSLGGALAVLATSRCLSQRMAPVYGLYTIGQPRVGDQQFNEDLNDKVAGRYFRYVNHRDAVPRVPPRAMKYHHAGKIMYFDGNGVLEEDASLWSRLLSVAFTGSTELKMAVKEAAGDHSSSEYVELLRNQV